MSAFTLLIPLLCVLVLAIVFVAALSHHKKSGMGELNLIGASATVENDLKPEGFVIARGELWPARALGGDTIERGRRVMIVGASGHLLEVEPILTASS